ncbi:MULTISPECIES: methionine ABC transporter permease [Actinomycetes]|uniref:D-methionine transport system permease protein n=1 Tax=Williamsia marianensis TaxID=85044 RepID=A0A315SA80_WILMA|nr:MULTISPECIES: methionine ABC transporter permease [Actinomycetes]ETD30296.1 methionine ABC transporter ATP-binding protein [Williamsia sp. D3]MDV7134383.1 methionine ABC transporter permease [Williamsia muralis]PVY31656.1 D-methionine transport system permease protein [Williamsia marianensis]RKR96455.1 D-methionine transport system permease protein [Williamsia muralis]
MFLGDIITPELRPILWDAVIQTFQLVGFTLVIGGVIGLGLGALLYATRPTNLLANTVVYNLLNVAVNIVRPIPFIIFITAMAPLTKEVMGTRIGTEAAIFPMTVMAVFVIGRVVEQNLVAVDPGVVEAARAMGTSRLRTLLTVVIPEGLAPLVLGYTFIFVAIVDMSAMAGYVGGGGLGDFAQQYGYQQFNWKLTVVVIAMLIVLVQLGQWLGNRLARRALHR